MENAYDPVEISGYLSEEYINYTINLSFVDLSTENKRPV